MLSCRRQAFLVLATLALTIGAEASSSSPSALRGSRARNNNKGTHLDQRHRREAAVSAWSNGNDLVHVVQTKFMQHQSSLLDLGAARLDMMKTVTIPSLEVQSSMEYLWIIWTTPKLDANLREELLDALEGLAENVAVIGFPGRIKDDFRSFDLSQVDESMVWFGDLQRVKDYHDAVKTRLLLDTRLDGNDALAETFMETLQTQAKQELEGSDADAWRVMCPKKSWEWRYYDDSNSEELMCSGRLVDVEHDRFCVNSGLTVVYGIDADIKDLPTVQQCSMHEEMPLCDEEKPALHRCISKIAFDGSYAVFRPRTAADAGMKHVYPNYETPATSTCETQSDCWESVEAQFPFDDLKIQLLRIRMENNIEDILKDAIEGQCTTGHSCSKKSLADLEKLLDEVVHIPSQCLTQPTTAPSSSPSKAPVAQPAYNLKLPPFVETAEDVNVPLVISVDDNETEYEYSKGLRVEIELPKDEFGPVGTVLFDTTSGDIVTVSELGDGRYVISSNGSSPGERASNMDAFTNSSITFAPRPQWSGVFRGESGIAVTVFSTKAVTTGDVTNDLTETNTAHISLVVDPVVDLPEGNPDGEVNENNGSSDLSDPPLVVSLAAAEFSIADTDGSQSLNLTITGFPNDASAITIDDVPHVTHAQVKDSSGATTITIEGEAQAVLAATASIDITLRGDSDENVLLTISGIATDTNGETTVSEHVAMNYRVTVKAVADMPKVEGPGEQPIVDEGSDFKLYPFDIALGDQDGSEGFRRVEILLSTPGSVGRHALPEIRYPNATLTTTTKSFSTSNTIRYYLSGPDEDLIEALANLEVKPGAHNGEDITVNVKAVAEERYPSERNSPHGGGKKGSEIFLSTAASDDEILIPVQPVVQEIPLAIHPAIVNSTEDLRFLLANFDVGLESADGSYDTDGSQTQYIEILGGSAPNDTFFYRSDERARKDAAPGWIRFQEHWYEHLLFQPGVHYSGFFNLTIRAVVEDVRRDGKRTATAYSEESYLAVYINPVVDPIISRGVICYSEDSGTRSVGKRIVQGIVKEDRATQSGNNPQPETVTQVDVDIGYDGPLEPDVGAWTEATNAPIPGVGSANIVYDNRTKSFIIASSILDELELETSSIDQRLAAEHDILATLDDLTIKFKKHSNENPVIVVSISAVDVNNGVMSQGTYDSVFTVNILGKADTPGLAVSGTSTVFENGDNIDISAVASNSADVDGSEVTSVRISVPLDDIPLGTVERRSSAEGNAILSDLGSGVYEIKSLAEDPTSRIAEINSLLQTGLSFNPRDDWAGSLTGEDGLKVTVISTEADESAEESVCAIETHRKATVSLYIPINVDPVQ